MNYPRAAWRGAIITALIVAGLIVASVFQPNPHLPEAIWEYPPVYLGIMILIFAPMVVFYAMAHGDRD